MINWQLLKSFVKHRLKAKARHGVHSPFVYNLIDKVIYDFKPRRDYESIEHLRKSLLADEREIIITDLGAGSHVNNNKRKKISHLAKNALKPKKLSQLIYRIANDRQPANIIELGTCLGLTTSYLARAVPRAAVVSIEGCPQTALIAKEVIQRLEITNVKLLTGNFDTLLPEIISQTHTLDFVFVDGNHRKDATLNYFYWCLSKVNEDTVLIFDDIYWSKGMEEAWHEIKNHPEVSVTVDLFWIGLVYFRKGQAKEHFYIKY
ncbi:MAG: class I SAM-dependent methyltransferase [Sphingobacteriaceae bacterium]|nr:class I SAM-dependent methyltransferase [Sphingobacteriaceae bacterium]